jgi:hypothetical protein
MVSRQFEYCTDLRQAAYRTGTQAGVCPRAPAIEPDDTIQEVSDVSVFM